MKEINGWLKEFYDYEFVEPIQYLIKGGRLITTSQIIFCLIDFVSHLDNFLIKKESNGDIFKSWCEKFLIKELHSRQIQLNESELWKIRNERIHCIMSSHSFNEQIKNENKIIVKFNYDFCLPNSLAEGKSFSIAGFIPETLSLNYPIKFIDIAKFFNAIQSAIDNFFQFIIDDKILYEIIEKKLNEKLFKNVTKSMKHKEMLLNV